VVVLGAGMIGQGTWQAFKPTFPISIYNEAS